MSIDEPGATTVAPLSFLWLELTGRCQLACRHCYADSSPAGSHGWMTSADWVRVIDEAPEWGVRLVQFIGGEPTLHPALPELIDHALSRALAVEVFTNLVHISDELWDTFAQPGVSLATSYYSDKADQHAAVTGRPSYARTKANITEAVRRGIPLRAGVIDLGDGQRVEAARTELADLGVARIGYDRLRQIGRGVRDEDTRAKQLCGRCGDGRAAVRPDGTVSPCVFARWVRTGSVLDGPLSAAVTTIPAARAELVEQGMPMRRGRGCNPDDDGCPPNGGDCYPVNE